MSTKNSQRRSKASTTTGATTIAPAAPAPEVAVAVAPAVEPVLTKAAPSETPVAAAPAANPKAPEASSPQRGSKRKAGAALEGGAEKKVKSSKKAKDAAGPAEPAASASTEKKKSRKKSDAAAGQAGAADAPKSSSVKSRKSKAALAAAEAAQTGVSQAAAVAEVPEGISGGEVKAEPAAPGDGNPNVSRYLRTLLKLKYPESTISREAIHEVQRLVYQFGLHFLITAKRHLESAKKNTLMPPDVPICLQRVLNGSPLYNEFFEAAVIAIKRYCDSYQDSISSKDVKEVVAAVDEKRKQMWASRAGLSIPPTRIKEFAKQYLSSFRFSQLSITGLTALLERLAALLFQLSYDKAQELNRKRISQADVQSAVKGYAGLQWLVLAPQLPIV